jgi:hypothetical protein
MVGISQHSYFNSINEKHCVCALSQVVANILKRLGGKSAHFRVAVKRDSYKNNPRSPAEREGCASVIVFAR